MGEVRCFKNLSQNVNGFLSRNSLTFVRFFFSTKLQACVKGGGGHPPPRFWQIRRRRLASCPPEFLDFDTCLICKSPVLFSLWIYTKKHKNQWAFLQKNNSGVPEKFSICASDYSRHEFQVLLSPMSTSFGLPNAEWKEFDVWTARPCITRLQQVFGNGVAGNNPINIWQMLLQTILPWNHTSHTEVSL